VPLEAAIPMEGKDRSREKRDFHVWHVSATLR